jgi:soluble lytic murein transglycosylase
MAPAALAAVFLSGCGPDASSDLPPERLVTIEPAPQLLPTPTLAAPANFDPLRPPTPIIMPSPTPLGSDIVATPAEPIEANIDEAPIETTAAQPTLTTSLPVGATPQELLELGRRAAAEGDQTTAGAAFKAVVNEPGDLEAAAIGEARLGLAVALMAQGENDAAALELEAVLQEPQAAADRDKGGELVAAVDVADVAAFRLGQARAAMGDTAGAIEAYKAYLQNNPDMAAYVQPLIADAYETLGDTEQVIAALEGATSEPAQRFKAVANYMRLAAIYLAREEYARAIAQYDAVHEIARTEATKGQMTYLAGQAELLAGNTAAAHERFQTAITSYPRAAESYYALVALLDAGVAVDEYQRGVVDYYAAAYQPAVDALRRYLSTPPDDYNKDAHLFLAWSYEGLGDAAGALAELDALAEYEPARALFERGELLRRAGRQAEALAAYDDYLENHADAESAPGVAWTAALLAEELGQADAVDRYRFLADEFPFADNTPLALFRAAELLAAAGDNDEAIALRRRLIEQYPANIYGAEALFRLLLAAERGELEGVDQVALEEQVATLSPTNYFALRAADFVAGIAPFAATGVMELPADSDEGREEAEEWLRERLTAEGATLPDVNLGALSIELAADPHRIVGEKLWRLGLFEEAKAELELVRETYAGDALANYQMARYFSELGLYRSSIISAAALLGQVGATVFDAPPYIGRLSYPIYYADLILPLAEKYDFDPRLQFALVRQESLFESFARSGAAAQGLSQVIPDTGAWIAQRLAWPGFVNEDLYKPYVGLNFGAYYLSEQLRNFDRHVHAALAAYNGGPGNAARWFDTAGADHDAYVDVVDFPETRLYIERIYEGFNAYRHLYGQP